MLLFLFIGLFCVSQGIESLIVPDEVPSLLSLIYSNIPPVKKGTDSRLGWGFRLGDHADFQVILELGPQLNTQKLGNEEDKNKRTVSTLRDTLYAQAQYAKQQRNREKQTISDTDGGKWLESWKSSMEESATENLAIPITGIGEVDAKRVIPPELEDLYGTRQAKSVNIKKTEIAVDSN